MKIGFIGLGGIGKPMALNVARAGFELTVHDLREEPVEELRALGANVATSAREVAAASDIVLASLPSNAASEGVALGADGVLAGAKAGDIYVELSTISPELVHRIAERAAAQGVTVLDAPVSGGIEQRQQGTLSVMVGGDGAALNKAMPVLQALGEKVFHVGGTGAGATVKLVNNMLAGIQMVAAMEALTLGVKAGLTVETLKDVIGASSGGSPMFRSMVERITTRSAEPPPGETANMGLHTIAKDMKLAVELAQSVDVPLAIGSAATQPFVAGLAHGWADKELWAIMEIFEETAAVHVRPAELRAPPSDSQDQ